MTATNGDGGSPRRRVAKKRVAKKTTKKVAKKVSARSRRGERASLTPAQRRAADRNRSTVVEMFDEEDGRTGVEQAYRGTQFWLRLSRPTGKCELDANRGRDLDERLIEDTRRIMAEGLPQYVAEGLLGMSEKAISNWCQLGKEHARKAAEWDAYCMEHGRKKAEADRGPRPDTTLQMRMRANVHQAESVGEASLFGAIVKAAHDGNPQAAQWLLERRFPERWGRLAMRTDIERDEDGNAQRNPIGELADALAVVAARLDS